MEIVDVFHLNLMKETENVIMPHFVMLILVEYGLNIKKQYNSWWVTVQNMYLK